MVSQPALVSGTLMEKPADVTVVEKMSADTPKQEGRTQKVTAKEGGCSQRGVAKARYREVGSRETRKRRRRLWRFRRADLQLLPQMFPGRGPHRSRAWSQPAPEPEFHVCN